MPESTPSRRTLHFTSLDQPMADARTLTEAETAGRLRSAGRWTLGQSLNHLACWVDYAYDGAPIKVPLVIRMVAPLLKKRMLYKPMRSGVRIPGANNGTLATEVVPSALALEHFLRALERLSNQPPTAASPLFGKLNHSEWIALHLRHAELHLSFLMPA